MLNDRGGSTLEPLADAALSFARGPQYRVTGIPAVLIVQSQFATRPLANGEWLDPDWPTKAHAALWEPGPRKS